MLNLKDLAGKVEANDIQQSINQRFPDHKYVIYNSYIFNWESDYLSVNESEYVYEVEIKVSLDDFKKDSHKKEKHVLLENKSETQKMPNKFFYACPRGIIPTIFVPEYAGLIEVSSTKEGMIAEVTKNAPFLHRDNILDTIKPLLLDKFYFKYKRTEFENYQLQKTVTLLQEQLKQKK
jgi:hypothetical protein